MDDSQEARFRAFYGRMETDDILKLLNNGTVSSRSAALAVLSQRGVQSPLESRREKKQDNDVDGEDGGLIQMALDFLGNLDFDTD
jgi:hypothetical protein